MDQWIKGSSSKSAWVYSNLNKYEQESGEWWKGGGDTDIYEKKILVKTGKLLLYVVII